jgi:hypothetical protein
MEVLNEAKKKGKATSPTRAASWLRVKKVNTRSSIQEVKTLKNFRIHRQKKACKWKRQIQRNRTASRGSNQKLKFKGFKGS